MMQCPRRRRPGRVVRVNVEGVKSVENVAASVMQQSLHAKTVAPTIESVFTASGSLGVASRSLNRRLAAA